MRRMTKKAMALVLHAEGATVEEIARQLDTRASYVANVLAAAGQRPAYHGFCRKSCSGGHEEAVAPVCGGIRQPGRRTVRPQEGPPFPL